MSKLLGTMIPLTKYFFSVIKGWSTACISINSILLIKRSIFSSFENKLICNHAWIMKIYWHNIYIMTRIYMHMCRSWLQLHVRYIQSENNNEYEFQNIIGWFIGIHIWDFTKKLLCTYTSTIKRIESLKPQILCRILPIFPSRTFFYIILILSEFFSDFV